MLSRLLKRRFPAYMGGLLLSLTAMVAIMTAKHTFAPKFHEVKVTLPADEIRPGGKAKILFNAEPGHHLPPGFRSFVAVLEKGAGDFRRIAEANYRELTGGDVSLDVMPVGSSGNAVKGMPGQGNRIVLIGELFICANPGVADCTKYVFERELEVKSDAKSKDSLTPIDLLGLAQKGLDAGAKGSQH